MPKARSRAGSRRAPNHARRRILPHDHVYARLAPSRIHGVGLFAIRSIPKSMPLFGEDDQPFSHVPKRVVAALSPEMRQLYEDFCILRGTEYLCPRSFNGLTPSWYLNHSTHPNVICDKDFTFFAARRIRKGEELTVDYRAYSDDPLPWLRRRPHSPVGRRSRNRPIRRRNETD